MPPAERSPRPVVREVLDLTGLLNHTGHVLETRLTAALGEAGLTPRAQCVLVHALDGPRSQIELAELAHLDKTTMVSTVDDLESKGWVERRPDPQDRRARIIHVTTLGRRAASTGQRIVDRTHQEVLASLSRPDSFLEQLESLAEGPLAHPVETPKVVRRPRRAT